MKKNLTLLAALLLGLAPTVPTHARGISWTSGVGDTFLTSDGITPMDNTYTFELGGFLTGFNPTLANLSLWQSNWVIFDSAVDPVGWNSGVGYYGSSATAVAAGAGFITSSVTGNTFSIGQQAYIWSFNSKTIAPTSEWSLIRNTTWTYPAADTLALPLDWSLSDVGTTAIAGATSTDGMGASVLQTQAVPEPGSALLILVAGVMIRLRRRYGR